MEWNGHHFRNITLNTNGLLETVRPDSAIYWTLEKFLKPLETINLNKSHTFLGNFCKDIKIYHFSSEIILGQLLLTFGNFFLVSLVGNQNRRKEK